jgi:glycosyltransferase involved in cell wall biosynthesis
LCQTAPWPYRTVPKPRLLVCTDWFPPGFRAGGPIRSTANLVTLLANDFEISVITSDRDFQATEPYPGLPPDTWLPYENRAQVRYLSPACMTAAAVGAIVGQTQPDCIYLNSMFSLPFTMAPLREVWRGRYRGRVVLAPRGMLHAGALRYKRLKKLAYLATFRASRIAKKIVFHATDEREAIDIAARGLAARQEIVTLPNVPEPPAVHVSGIVKRPGELRLLFLGRVSPKKNILALIERLAREAQRAETELGIVGPIEDPAYWQRCQAAIASLPRNVQVTYHGAVAHADVHSLVTTHHFFVLPTFGENFGHAIFEALGVGRPVIISDQTPWRGLAPLGIGWDLPNSDSEAWSQALRDAAALDQDRYDAMSQRSWAFAREWFAATDLRREYAALLGSPLPQPESFR